MNSDIGNKQECISVVMRHVALRDVVERVKPLNSEQKVPPVSTPLIESENDLLPVPAVALKEAISSQGDQANILNFTETASIANQIPSMFGIIKTGQPTKLPIIQEEHQDRVKEKRVPAIKIAGQLAEFYQFGAYEDDVYVFETSHYNLCSDKYLERMIYSVLKSSDIIPSGYRFLQDIRNFLRLETMLKKFTEYDVERRRKYIGFKNGYLHLDTMKFTAPNPAIFITNYLDVNYNPQLLAKVGVQDFKKIHCPNFDQFVYTLADGNPLIFDRIFEMIGYIVSNDCAAKKLFALMGPSDTGKSQIGKFILGLFNKEATIALPLSTLGERFSLGKLPGKALAVDLDLPGAKISSRAAAIIKSLTGGDVISAENKFEPSRTFTSYAKLLYATNHQIEISSKEEVLRNRFVSIPIMRVIPKEKQIPNLLDCFKAERFLIVMKSIGYYRELVKNNYVFTGDFSLNSAFISNNSVIAMSMEDMINKFAAEQCSFVSEQWEFTDTLYKAFCGYYDIPEDDNGYKNFSRMFCQLFNAKIGKTKKRRENASSPLSAFSGVVLKL